MSGVGEAEPPLGVALMLTRRCNMSCSHCSVESGPKVKGEPGDGELIATIHSIADAGLKAVQITGGEPMIREKLVLELLRTARARGLSTTLSTNGFWGRNPASAWRKVAALKRAGLGRITVSYDRYHAEFQGPDPALNIARAAEWFDLPFNLNITRVRDDPELAGLVAPFEKRHQLKMRFYDVQVIGRARQLPVAGIRGELTGFCNACTTPAITDDGRVTACNGPAYFLGSDSPLVVGSLRESPLPDLLETHTDDSILETIRRAGPLRLLQELEAAGATREIGIREQHSGLCDLCIDINSNPAAVAVLRERLGRNGIQAELAARRMMIRSSAAERTMGLEYANGAGAVKLWLDAAAGRLDRFDAAAEKILGRADFDWNRSIEYLLACGMAPSLAAVASRASLRKWAPTFFVEKLQRGAIRSSMVDMSQREVLRRLSETLTGMQARGVLLKGAAFHALESFGGASHSGRLPRRNAGDVDLYVAPEAAFRLRDELMRAGFKGDAHGPRTGPHHLAPLSFNGVEVEIHTRIMPLSWNLPEAAMLRESRPVPGLPGVDTLDPEGMLLHALVHSTAHLFSHGMRAVWDAAWILERNPNLDTARLLDWVSGLAMPRSFWVPARAITKRTLALPQDLMRHAPVDERQRRLERVAEARMFSAVEGAYDLNPLSKNGFFLLLHDSPLGRLRHVAHLFGRDERESRRSAWARAKVRNPVSGHSVVAFQLREGLTHWRNYKRIAGGPQT